MSQRAITVVIASLLLIFISMLAWIFANRTFGPDQVLRSNDLDPHRSGLTRKIESVLAAHGMGGAFVLTKGGQSLALGYVGMADPAAGIPITPETRFNVGSVTKQFTGYLLLELIQEGKITLADPVSTHIPELSGKPIGKATVDQLMRMTSGLPQIPPMWKFLGIQMTSDIWSEQKILDLIASVDLKFAPGNRFSYSNLGYTLLGILIGRIERSSWSQAIHNRIFSRFGMSRSTTEGENATCPDTLAVGLVPFTLPLLELQRFVAMPHWNYSVIRGAGGIVSTMEDLRLWQKGLSDRASKDPQWAKAYFESGTKQNKFYSFGWDASTFDMDDGSCVPFYRHDGEDPGYCTVSVRFPKTDVVFLLTSNTDYCLKSGWATAFNTSIRPVFLELNRNSHAP